MKFRKRGLCAFAVSAMAVGLLSGCSDQEGEGKLVKVSVGVSNQTPAAQALEEVLKPAIEEKTNGKYNIQIYYSGVLGSEKVVYDYTRSGIIEMCVLGTPMWSETPKMSIPICIPGRGTRQEMLSGRTGGLYHRRYRVLPAGTASLLAAQRSQGVHIK